MTTRILIYLITTVAIFATCLEGRYHLEPTGLRHHRHDRHRQVWDQDPVPRGSRRRDWDENDEGEETPIDRRHKEGSAVSSGRRITERNFPLVHDRRGFGGAAHRGRYESQRRGRGRSEGGHLRRDYHHGNSASSWRHDSKEGAKGRRENNRRSSSSSGRGERPWSYRDPARYDRRRDEEVEDYTKGEEWRRGRFEDEDEGYEADDEGYYPPKKPGNPYEGHSKGRRNRHGDRNHRFEDEEDDGGDEEEDYDEDYEDYDDRDTEKRQSRRKHGKRLGDFNDFDDLRFEKKKGSLNEVTGRRGAGRRDRISGGEKENRGKPEDLNEVEENDDVEEDVWGDAETDEDDGSLDEYDEAETSDFGFKDAKETIEDIIRRLTAGDATTTPKSPPRREYRNIEIENHPLRDRYGKLYEAKVGAKLQPHRMVHKKIENRWETTTTTTTTTTPSTTAATTTATTKRPGSYAKNISELKRVTNSPRNDVGGTTINKKTTRVNNGARVDVEKTLVSQLAKTDPDAKTKSLEQDYEEYENDGSDDKTEDVEDADGETENDKKWPSEKDQDYNEDEIAEDNDEETERTPSTTTSIPPTTTTMSATTTTTTTTTSTTTPPPIYTRAFDHRQSRVLDTRSRPNSLKNFQTSTAYPPMSNYSAHKWNTLGNRRGINERRNSKMGSNLSDSEVRKALFHAQQMQRETVCRWPRAKVISVRDVHISPSKTYNPTCIILHRCADDTGCCSPEYTCVPKHLHSVELPFYAASIEGSSVEKLKFDNHTECQCRPRTPPPPPPPPPTTTMKPCKCPSLFTPRNTPEHGCLCECHDNQLRCLRQKRGKDYFTRNDQWCIKTKQCTMPPCEFGDYMRMAGRCPLRSERFDKVNYFSNSNVRQRN